MCMSIAMSWKLKNVEIVLPAWAGSTILKIAFSVQMVFAMNWKLQKSGIVLPAQAGSMILKIAYTYKIMKRSLF